MQVTVGHLRFSVGYLKYENSLWDRLPYRVILVGLPVLLLVLCGFFLAGGIHCWRLHRPQKVPRKTSVVSSHSEPKDTLKYIGKHNINKKAYSIVAIFTVDVPDSVIVNPMELLEDDLKFKVKNCLVNMEEIVLLEVIGKGNGTHQNCVQ